jgi:hypothetical protein
MEIMRTSPSFSTLLYWKKTEILSHLWMGPPFSPNPIPLETVVADFTDYVNLFSILIQPFISMQKLHFNGFIQESPPLSEFIRYTLPNTERIASISSQERATGI